jgi:hypothetical protein
MLNRRVAVVLTILYVWGCAEAAQDQKSNLTQQLQSQYVLTKVSGSSNITTPGTVLTIQKPDLVGSQAGELKAAVPNTYKDGKIKHGMLGSIAAGSMGNAGRPFQVGETVYLVKIEVKDNDLVFNVLSCDEFDGARYRASVSFAFGKGYWASADLGQIQQKVGELFAVSADAPATAGAQPSAGPQKPMAPIAPPAAPPDQQQAQQTQTQSIEIGQTPDQVTAILGQPDKIVKLASKQIYVYKNLKVTFKDGKVSDVQ